MRLPVSQPKRPCSSSTQVVVAPASIDGTDARLEPHATAVAGRPNDRPDHLRTERRTNKAGRNCGGRAAARAARRAGQVPGVAGTTQLVAANSVVTVFPRITAPASRNAATAAASRSERQPSNKGEPICVAMSAVSIMSLMPIGMPSITDGGTRPPSARSTRQPLLVHHQS